MILRVVVACSMLFFGADAFAGALNPMGTGSFECNGMGINFAFSVPSLSVYEFTYECGTHRTMYNSNGEYQEAFNGWIKVQASYSPGSKRATETARWVVGGQVRAKIDWEGSCPNDPGLVANVNCETSCLKDDIFDPNSHKQYDLESSNYYSSSMFYDWWKDTGHSAYPVTAQMSVQQRAELIKKNHDSSTKPPLALAPPSPVILSPADGAIFSVGHPVGILVHTELACPVEMEFYFKGIIPDFMNPNGTKQYPKKTGKDFVSSDYKTFVFVYAFDNLGDWEYHARIICPQM